MAVTEKEKRLSEKEKRSKGISDLVRFISFGLVALTYSLFTSKADFAIALLASHKTLFLIASISGVISLTFDYLNYLCGYIAVNAALKENDFKYVKSWRSYSWIKPCFVLKQISGLVGVIAVCIAMILSVIA